MNPMEASYPPDEAIEHFTIKGTRIRHGSMRGETWYVTCPEWNYKNETNEAIDKHVSRIVTEIRKHNEEIH